MKRPVKFTLMELLIVVAVLGILISLLLPSLTKARETVKLAVCMSNMNQLSKSYLAYTSGNNSKLISSSSQTENNMPPWIIHSSWNFDTNVLVSPMWPYLQNKEVFRCPNENRSNVLSNGNYKRTYSINSYLNGNIFGIDSGKRVDSLYKVESAEDTLKFIGEKDPRGSNINSFSVGTSSSWVDWPASNHGLKKTSVNFLDGHCRIYNFINKSTSQINNFYSQDGSDDRREFLKMASPEID